MKLKLPIDIPAVFKTANELKEAAAVPLSIGLYLDESAPKPLIAHVRAAFQTDSANVRMTVDYLDEGSSLSPHHGDDMAVIVAGALPGVGDAAQILRDAGIPVMVVTLDPAGVTLMATQSGYPIPDGDLVYPVAKPKDSDGVSTTGEVFSAELFKELDKRMGRWVAAACSAKKISFALCFPFVRRPLAVDAVNATSLENAAVGAVNFIPGADMPIMTLNQAKMLLQIATAYGQPLSRDRIIELAMVVGGGFALRAIARQLTGFVPVLGWAIKGAIGYTGTQAMGWAAIEYFEQGGDIVGLAGVVQKARNEAVEVAEKVATSPVGRKVTSSVKSLVTSGVERLKARGAKRAS